MAPLVATVKVSEERLYELRLAEVALREAVELANIELTDHPRRYLRAYADSDEYGRNGTFANLVEWLDRQKGGKP